MTVLVTGANSGIGLATALRLWNKGYRVFGAVRRLESARGVPFETVRIDVNDDASVDEGVAEVLRLAPRIDVLVNNAGIAATGPIETVPLETAREMFETNYFGAIRMIRAVVPAMRERQAGAIVNVTSVAGRVATAAHGHYCASKYALEAASESLALELRPFGVRVAIIEPGVILTPIFEKKPPRKDRLGKLYYEVPLRRLERYFERQLQNPQGPELVAEAVEHAITTDTPRLRYLVGEDAKALVASRYAGSDEDWVEDHAAPSDEEYLDRMKRRAGGIDLYRA